MGSSSRKRIILVDDDVDHLLVSKLLLERYGYEVLPLNDCQDLLENVRRFHPGLIFMDHGMPDMMGTEATRLLKSDEGCRKIPVIYFSGWENIQKLVAEAGADGFLKKPFNIDEMVAVIEKFWRAA